MAKYLDPKAGLTFKKVCGEHKELVASFLNVLLPLGEGKKVETVCNLKETMMKTLATVMMAALCAFGAQAESEVEVTGVTAQQRYPWNGMVDIVVTIRGESSDVASADCLFVATNCATEAAIPVEHITQKGNTTGSGTVWTRKFVWDAQTDVGAVKIDDVALVVNDIIFSPEKRRTEW